MELKPPPLALLVVIAGIHGNDGRDAGEAEDHDTEQGAVAQAGQLVQIDAVISACHAFAVEQLPADTLFREGVIKLIGIELCVSRIGTRHHLMDRLDDVVNLEPRAAIAQTFHLAPEVWKFAPVVRVWPLFQHTANIARRSLGLKPSSSVCRA